MWRIRIGTIWLIRNRFRNSRIRGRRFYLMIAPSLNWVSNSNSQISKMMSKIDQRKISILLGTCSISTAKYRRLISLIVHTLHSCSAGARLIPTSNHSRAKSSLKSLKSTSNVSSLTSTNFRTKLSLKLSWKGSVLEALSPLIWVLVTCRGTRKKYSGVRESTNSDFSHKCTLFISINSDLFSTFLVDLSKFSVNLVLSKYWVIFK